ncbi:flagellar basal body rod protein FlgB [Clostridium algidicarnis]|uniref:Flagellar basal body rod protein FlgB n=1 Tax=Clostridium algidicarnis TaxID=37659 RepID=A0ABS6BZ77_9CLOT|nr:flagellar basal body rod protein FlgB [Clostridium algidicarnis]MBU3218547.1 flagellar basal body rod protein FlgB [Clostridium algidicarnis]MCB2286548.1 flagellar basal body rod protein FlgB [Clostridium algidicarnis]
MKSSLIPEERSYNMLKKSLDASSIRGKTIANNIANINTKGYKKYQVKFEETLNESFNEFKLKTTNEKHINKGQSYGDIEVVQDQSSSMREDGNNVDIENEKVNQAANTLMYNTLVSQANSKLSNLRYVITGGGR